MLYPTHRVRSARRRAITGREREHEDHLEFVEVPAPLAKLLALVARRDRTPQ